MLLIRLSLTFNPLEVFYIDNSAIFEYSPKAEPRTIYEKLRYSWKAPFQCEPGKPPKWEIYITKQGIATHYKRRYEHYYEQRPGDFFGAVLLFLSTVWICKMFYRFIFLKGLSVVFNYSSDGKSSTISFVESPIAFGLVIWAAIQASLASTPSRKNLLLEYPMTDKQPCWWAGIILWVQLLQDINSHSMKAGP